MRAKYILLAAGILVVIAIVGIYVIISRFDYNSLKPKVEQAAYDATGRKLNMEGDIKLKIGFSPTLAIENVGFENASWGSQPEMATVKRLEVQVALIPLLRKEVRIKRLILVEPDILIETNSEGKSNLTFEKVGEETTEKEQPAEQKPGGGKLELPALAFDQMRIEDGRLTYKDGKTNQVHTATLTQATASAPKENGPIKISAAGAYDKNPFDLSGTVGSIAEATDPAQSWPVKLHAETLGTVVDLDGSIQDVTGAKGIDVNVTAKGQSIAQLTAFAGMQNAPDTGPFTVAVKVTDPAASTYKLSDFKVTIPDSDLAGSMEVALAGERPRITAALTSKKIDLRPLMGTEENAAKAPETESKEPESKPKRERLFPQDKLPVDMLKMLDGKISLQAGQILLPKIALNNVTTEIALEDGSLTARPIKATTGGGSFDGQAGLSAKGENADMNLAIKIDQLALGPMLTDLGITDRLEGNLNADVELAGQGASVADLMGGLNGTTIMTVEGGRVNNKYLTLVENNLGGNLFNLLNPAAKDEKYTDLNCVVSRFDIEDGMAKSAVLLVDTSGMTVVGSGTIDLKTEKLSISLVPSPKKGIVAQAGSKVGVNLGQLVKPFKLGGTLADPRLAIDTKQSAIMIGKAVGGTALFGPVGLAAVLVGGGSTEKDPCSAAKKIAETGEVPETAAADQQEKGTVEQVPEDVSNAAKSVVGGAEEQFKKIFGR